ncbi:hypothetical protein Sar04_31790 [Salinispora arenicola]|uniref:Uncharacterized protein n=1 Tax=Salinispora arenicola TaxID=168697 RepID=A0ABQ4JWG3_SALAC|nr:hypothetical protein Sar04_31790 [Salinispora arenicola]
MSESGRPGLLRCSFDTPYPRFSVAWVAVIDRPSGVTRSTEDRLVTFPPPSVARARHCDRGLDVTGVGPRLKHLMPSGTADGQNRKSYRNVHILKDTPTTFPPLGEVSAWRSVAKGST